MASGLDTKQEVRSYARPVGSAQNLSQNRRVAGSRNVAVLGNFAVFAGFGVLGLLGACTTDSDGSGDAAPATAIVTPAATGTPAVVEGAAETATSVTEAGASIQALDPAAAASALYSAWRASDRDIALLVAEADVVEHLFAIAPTEWAFAACTPAPAPGVTICTFSSGLGPVTLTVAATTSIAIKVVDLDVPTA